MHPSFHVRRLVEFCETDAAGIAHFSAFFQYMEQAEHALLRHLGLSVKSQDAEGAISWPRVNAHCDYLAAVRFEDELDIAVSVKRLGTKSVCYAFEFTHGPTLVAKGEITAVCCRMFADQPPQPIAIPDRFAQPLRTYVIPQP
jgi:acyl-CoA thioester hydrolase